MHGWQMAIVDGRARTINASYKMVETQRWARTLLFGRLENGVYYNSTDSLRDMRDVAVSH